MADALHYPWSSAQAYAELEEVPLLDHHRPFPGPYSDWTMFLNQGLSEEYRLDMPTGDPVTRPSKTTNDMAMFLALVVRNAMEDFHCEHLSDEQMEELNPIIRNAIYTGLHAISCYSSSAGARQFVNLSAMMIPEYWEPPELLPDFLGCVKSVKPKRPVIKTTKNRGR